MREPPEGGDHQTGPESSARTRLVPAADPVPVPARPLVESLVASGGGHICAVLLFGSQLSRAAPSPHSAWDLVVVVDEYGPFHRALVDTGHHRRPAWLLSLVGRILAPNITAFDPGGRAPLAKCAIVSAKAFARAVGPNSPDHFLKGRMVQNVALLWAKSDDDAIWVRDRLRAARHDVLNWAGPFLEGPFTPAEFAHGMLRVSYGGEVRPENKDRVDAVFEAQRDFLTDAYTDVLEAESDAKGARVRRVGDRRYELHPPPGWGDRLRLSLYFAWSKVRAVVRWPKHILTFNDWLTYIQRKVERRTGMHVEVTPWERRLPLLLLWPKVFRVLRARKASPAEREEAS